MPTKPTDAEIAAYRALKAARQAEYDNFRYTDTQREQVLEFIAAAMKVLRGEAPFISLQRLVRIYDVEPWSPDGEAYLGGNRYSFDAKFLNKWTSIYVLGTQDSVGEVEPYHLKVDFSPPMTIQRERLESLLQLKVAPGWFSEGGNLWPPGIVFDGPPPKDSLFQYSPLHQPAGDYAIEVKLHYGGATISDPYKQNVLLDLSITRRYLTPEKIRERDDKKVGVLPRSGERVPADGKYVPVFADDELTRAAREQGIAMEHGAGDVFQRVRLRHPHTGQAGWFEAGWQRIDFGRRG